MKVTLTDVQLIHHDHIDFTSVNNSCEVVVTKIHFNKMTSALSLQSLHFNFWGRFTGHGKVFRHGKWKLSSQA